PQIDLNMGDARSFAGEDFATASYANASTGAIPWNGNWVETDVAGAAQSASAGNVIVTGGELDLSKATSGVQRAVNLASQSTDSLNRLSFNYRTSANVDAGGDKLDDQLSAAVGSTWIRAASLDVGPIASG